MHPKFLHVLSPYCYCLILPLPPHLHTMIVFPSSFLHYSPTNKKIYRHSYSISFAFSRRGQNFCRTLSDGDRKSQPVKHKQSKQKTSNSGSRVSTIGWQQPYSRNTRTPAKGTVIHERFPSNLSMKNCCCLLEAVAMIPLVNLASSWFLQNIRR